MKYSTSLLPGFTGADIYIDVEATPRLVMSPAVDSSVT